MLKKLETNTWILLISTSQLYLFVEYNYFLDFAKILFYISIKYLIFEKIETWLVEINKINVQILF